MSQVQALTLSLRYSKFRFFAARPGGAQLRLRARVTRNWSSRFQFGHLHSTCTVTELKGGRTGGATVAAMHTHFVPMSNYTRAAQSAAASGEEAGTGGAPHLEHVCTLGPWPNVCSVDTVCPATVMQCYQTVGDRMLPPRNTQRQWLIASRNFLPVCGRSGRADKHISVRTLPIQKLILLRCGPLWLPWALCH